MTQATTPLTVSTEVDFQFDPFDPDVMATPLPYYRVLRERYPVYYIPKYDTYFLSRFEDALQLLTSNDNTFVSSEGTVPMPDVLRTPNGGDPPWPTTTPLAPQFMQSSPTYELLRQAHNRPLRPGAVRRMAELVRELARERLDLLMPRGRFDLTQHYGGIVAAAMQCHLFRIPLSEAKYVLDMVNSGSITDPRHGGFVSVDGPVRLHDLLQGQVRKRRKEGADGSWPIVDGLLTLEIDGRRLEDHEIGGVLTSVLVGGTETVPKVVAHGLWMLQQHPEQEKQVRADLAGNVTQAFREMVRLGGPAQWFMRTVHKPTTLLGHELGVGQRVAYIVPSAARDEREYGEDAEAFRWDRPNERLINFGHGQHFCTGFHLAMLEGSILVEEFLRRVPGFEVEEDKVVRLPSNFQWGYNELPIRVPRAD